LNETKKNKKKLKKQMILVDAITALGPCLVYVSCLQTGFFSNHHYQNGEFRQPFFSYKKISDDFF